MHEIKKNKHELNRQKKEVMVILIYQKTQGHGVLGKKIKRRTKNEK